MTDESKKAAIVVATINELRNAAIAGRVPPETVFTVMCNHIPVMADYDTTLVACEACYNVLYESILKE